MKHFIQVSVCTLLLTYLSSCKQSTVFNGLPSSYTGIHFNNNITENDSINPLDITNIYNGGGVGMGDFNNDGLQDIYFTGNMVSNKLYLNKGDMKFEDITQTSGTDGKGEWCRGVSVVDINNDGKTDIYVCATILPDPEKRKNLLYINNGNDKNGIPHFTEMASAYGLDDTTSSTMAEFFDYDNDGDLDMYLVVNEIVPGVNPSFFKPIIKDGSFPSTGRLYKNIGSDSLGHPFYKDVSKQAGITIEGYGHGATVADINQDGWKDIFVSNDFVSNDILYINNHDGTFTDKAALYFKHTSANGMGQDITDINNDGLADVVELDMNPRDNYRKKMMLNGNNYQTYINTETFGYQYQYVRNTLQLNQGKRVLQDDSVGDPIFSDIGFMSGIAETDWSWTPLVADFDNDSYRDIIITNGFPKDVTDHDFIAFRKQSFAYAKKQFTLSQIPQVKIKNYAFHNNGNLTFTDVSSAWGITTPSFSNGAAYADLDNDGDLDYVVNNINDEASVYQNQTNNADKHGGWLNIHFEDKAPNINGLGAVAELHYDGHVQVYENTPYRGYLSTHQCGAFFGTGDKQEIDSILIKWPDGKMQLLQHIKTNQIITVKHDDATIPYSWNDEKVNANTLLKDITGDVNISYIHKEDDFIDFNYQRLLPHKLSDYGPPLATDDINGDGLDDIIAGASAGNIATTFLQKQNGNFEEHSLLSNAINKNNLADDAGIVLFDADNDGDKDLYIARGGNESPAGSINYADAFYINDGKGNFILDTTAFPVNLASKSCIRVIDFDKDGDMDIFIAGRCVPQKYPLPASCFLYRNDSKNDVIHFTDITKQAAPQFINAGLICDASITDYNKDGWPDIMLAGEFMPLEIFKNDHGHFQLIQSSLDNYKGAWNCLAAADFDGDGDTDFVAGNMGLNSFYRGDEKHPVHIYAKDFNHNGSLDQIPSVYLPAQDGTLKEFPAFGRDDLIDEMIDVRRKFPFYKDFAVATMDKIIPPDSLQDAIVLEANYFSTSFIRNDGNDKFTVMPLPVQAQLSPAFSILVADINHDNHSDIIINGNDFGTEIATGRYDALNGLVILSDGKNNFTPLSVFQSGLFIPGNGKALALLKSAAGKNLIAASQNRGPLKIFEIK